MATPKRKIKKREKSATPIYFLSLTIENVRCFGPKQTLDLSDGHGCPAPWTIILGDNGVGKTTLLQCLVALLPTTIPELSQFSSDIGAISVPLYVNRNIIYGSFSDWSPSRYGRNGLQFISTFSIGSKLQERLTSGSSGKLGIVESVPQNVEGIIHRTIDIDRTGALNNLMCVAYGAARQLGELAISDDEKSNPTISLFSNNAALLNAEEWILQTDYIASKPSPIQQRAVERREQIKEVLINLLPDIDDIRFVSPTDLTERTRVEWKTPYGWVSLKDLSLGYKTLIAWMVDFASRMFDQYPNSSNPLAEPAVVLVDEIDLHLHPTWQRKLMSYLSERFPNTQFIATAHSPLVVQAAENANIVLLRREGDHVVIDNDPQTIKGWRVDQILTSELFGLESARPPEYQDALAERKQILSKARLTKKDKERLRDLESRIGALPTGETPQEIEAMDIIRRAAERLKKDNNKPHK